MADASGLYDQDFFLWTQEQAAALRRAKDSNLPLDWENLAEEIECLGKSDRRELTLTDPAYTPSLAQTRSLACRASARRMALRDH
jgi:hypothetical protein